MTVQGFLSILALIFRRMAHIYDELKVDESVSVTLKSHKLIATGRGGDGRIQGYLGWVRMGTLQFRYIVAPNRVTFRVRDEHEGLENTESGPMTSAYDRG